MAYDFDFPTVETLSKSGSVKWSRFPDTLAMWVAEMDFGISPELRDFIIDQAELGNFGYLPQEDSVRTLEATSTWLATFGLKPDPARMVIIPEVLQGLRETIKHFTPAGSAVVVPTPAYMPFLSIPGEFDREVIQVPSHLDAAGTWRLDFPAIEAAFENGAGLFILCNPWNPTGRCLDRSELEEIERIVQAHSGRVFEDAIHAPLALEAPYIPYASIGPAAAAHTITAVAASKGWNIPGLKCAQLIFNNEADWKTFEPFAHAVSAPTSTIGVRATEVAYVQSQKWNHELVQYLAANRSVLEERVAGWNGVELAHIEGTYIGFLDFSGLGATGVFGERSPAQFIREEAGVAFTDGASCGAGFETYARIIFATSRAILTEALDRIESALPELIS